MPPPVLSRSDIRRLFFQSYPEGIPTFIVLADWEGFGNLLVETTPEQMTDHWIRFDKAVGRFLAEKNISKFTNYHP